MVTLPNNILFLISPQANRELGTELVPFMNKYFPMYDITTLLRLDYMLGQCAEESAGYRTLTEYGSGREYEGRQDLGNTQPGDGPRFKGRGMIQLTGRANYQKMSQTLGIDLISNPDICATPELAVRTACEYWRSRNINMLADQDDMNGVTRAINGGLTGINDRIIFVNRADNILSHLFPTC